MWDIVAAMTANEQHPYYGYVQQPECGNEKWHYPHWYPVGNGKEAICYGAPDGEKPEGVVG